MTGWKFEGFEIYPADVGEDKENKIWFRRTDGEGMVISKQLMKEALY